MTPWRPDERESVHDGTDRVWATVRLALAGGALLRVELADGRKVWRRG